MIEPLRAALATAAFTTAAFTNAVAASTPTPAPLPPGFVYLSDVAPTIVQDIRYASVHNFLGRKVRGYESAACILTKQAAAALAKVQTDLLEAGLTLRVYDCYRPQRAVNDFVAWSKVASDQQMKAEFYPRVDKSTLFALGYVAAKSGHTRGSTVDLTIERYPLYDREPWVPGVHSCIGPFMQRYHDGSIDMGTSFDCLDSLSHVDAEVGNVAYSHRMLLRSAMEKHGFVGYKEEWWHFTLASEPFPTTYFDFPVAAPRP